MADEERIFQLLAQMASRQTEIQRDIDKIANDLFSLRHTIEPIEKGYQSMRADITRIQLDMEKVRDTQYNLVECMGAIRSDVCAQGDCG